MTCSCDNAGDDQVRNFAPGGDEREAQSALGQACDLADDGGPPDHAESEYGQCPGHPNDAADAGQPNPIAHERKVKVFLPKRARQKDILGLLWMNMLPFRLRGDICQDCQ